MWDWIKFFPFSYEQDKKNIEEIRGPYFSRPRKNKWIFNDTAFYFKAPWVNPVFAFDYSRRFSTNLDPSTANILNHDWKRWYYSTKAPAGSWDIDLFYEKCWYFVGPWFTGMKARLIMRGTLLSARRNTNFNKVNLFHPRAFELAVSDHLDFVYGYQRWGKKAIYRGPLNWHVLSLSSTVQAIVCDVHEIHNGGKDNPSLHRSIFFPVSEYQFVDVFFDFGGEAIYRDTLRAKPLLSLCDSIIDSMTLDVGRLTLAKWEKVRETCPDMSLSEEFGEFPWPLFKEKSRKKNQEKDITAFKENTIEAQEQKT